MDVDQIKRDLAGEWNSLATEVRPSAAKNPDGTLKPFYLTRDFRVPRRRPLRARHRQLRRRRRRAVPLARMEIRGHMLWRGPHPVAAGAQKVDFVADEGYDVTPLVQGFADVLGKIAGAGYATWTVGGAQSVFGKSFAPFGLAGAKTSWSTTSSSWPATSCTGARATSTAAGSIRTRIGRRTCRFRSRGGRGRAGKR